MIHSMTAYAQEISNSKFGSITWELRSLNHRYLECYFKLPDSIRDLEHSLREAVRNNLARGKVDCILQLNLEQSETVDFDVNLQVLQALMSACQKLAQTANNLAPISALDILRWPGVLQNNQQNQQELSQQIVASFKTALAKLQRARQSEGQQLAQVIENNLVLIQQQLQFLEAQLPEILQQQQQRLTGKIQELKLQVDQDRLTQEYVYLLQKSDVNEEIARLRIHLKEIEQVCRTGGSVGKKLDFLVQELNREANTIAAKSLSSISSSVAVELKVLIEQIREQVQNIE